MESENTITTAVDVPNVEASIPVNVTVGTLVSFSHLYPFLHFLLQNHVSSLVPVYLCATLKISLETAAKKIFVWFVVSTF